MVLSILLRIRILAAAAVFMGTVSAQTDAAPAPAPGSTDPQKAEAPAVVFHQSVRRVIVDVVVSDSNGNPVPGLTAADFAIAEDGSPQHIRAFDIHNFDSLSDSLPKPPESLPANTFLNVPAEPERGPLYVLLLDLLNMSVDDQPVARQQLLKFIRSKPLGTRFAVFVLSDGLYLVQGFTEDRNRLADVLDPKTAHSHLPKLFLYADQYQPYFSTTRALIRIAGFMADLPGRKNVIWLSASFPTAMLPTTGADAEALTSSEELKEATDALARGQIAVYPVDVRGAVVTHVSARPMNGSMSTTTDSPQLNASYMTEEEIAHTTGGRAFYNSNDLASALTEATEAGGHYYTLTYSPSNQNYDGHLRHIKVELANRGYRLEYRRSYYGNPNYGNPKNDKPSNGKPSDGKPGSGNSGNPGDRNPSNGAPSSAATLIAAAPASTVHLASESEPHPAANIASSLSRYLQHGTPLAHQLLFRAHIHTLAPPARATPEQMAKLANPANRENKALRPIQLQSYEIDYSIAARYPALEIAAAAFDADGKTVNAQIQLSGDVAAQAAPQEDIYRFQQHIDLPTTATSVRLAVRDVITDNVGALEINLPLAPEAPTASAHTAGSFSEPEAPSAPQ